MSALPAKLKLKEKVNAAFRGTSHSIGVDRPADFMPSLVDLYVYFFSHECNELFNLKSYVNNLNIGETPK